MDREEFDTKKVTIRVPGSTSNLASGFDTVSAALSLYLELEVEITEGSGIEWPSEWSLPDAENMILKSLQRACEHLGCSLPGLKIQVENEIPLKRGLGSSAAAIVAGIKLAEAVSNRDLSTAEVLEIAFPLERHPDNLAASALGGWTISLVTGERMTAEKLTSRLETTFVVAIPEIGVSTAEARAILPESYSLSDAVFNLQRVALLIHALSEGRTDLLPEACRDRLHQSYRARLVPGLEGLLQRQDLPAELEESLVTTTVSGSGSTVLAMVTEHAERIGDWMVSGLERAGTPSVFRVLTLDETGPVVIRETKQN